jgi:hypothetical protein
MVSVHNSIRIAIALIPKTATLINPLLEIAVAAEEMATTVLRIGEWLLKQQQQLNPLLSLSW